MKAPAFQFYAGDFFIDTIEWSLEAVGLYSRLLSIEWTNGPLPTDEKKLAKIAGISSRKLVLIWPEISSKFQRNNEDKYVNLRLEETREKQAKYSESRRKGAIAKHNKERAYAEDTHVHMDCTPSPSPSPTLNIKEIKNNVGSVSKRPRRTYAFTYDWDKKCFEGITEEMKAGWRKAYPSIDIDAQLLDMEQKIPTNGYHKQNWPGFVVRWLSRSQDKAKANPQAYQGDLTTDWRKELDRKHGQQ